MRITSRDELDRLREKGLKKIIPSLPRVTVGLGTCGRGNDAEAVYREFAVQLKKKKVKALLVPTGCFGFCAEEPLVSVYLPGSPLLLLSRVRPKDVKNIVEGIARGEVKAKNLLCKIEAWDHHTEQIIYGEGYSHLPCWDELSFFKKQKKIVLRDCGIINPDDIEEYIAVGGYSSLGKVLHRMTPDKVMSEIKTSRLRGRGGAGFPVWRKWQILKERKEDKKFLICNADEGDPGAYMNRNELEGDPYMIIEGMTIAAYATGASEGIIYCRAEYPLAVERLRKAIDKAGKYGLLGANIMGTDFNFTLYVVEGAGAFVCGEETALIASIENKSGRPLPRPPFPAEKGVWGYPTNINNVETWANIPVIICRGGSWFAKTGTEKSPGTKVFSLVGKIKNTGLVELPLGTSLQTLVYDIGGGTGNNKKVKAVQSGGPSGGCIPARLFDTAIDYESLAELGSIMGSGGMVVMDEDNCMVDVARYFTEFTTSESCGKCVPCREGLNQALKMLGAVTEGKAELTVLDTLQELGEVIKDTALCGLGQTGPNPILTTMRYFRDEYEQHIIDKYCAGGVCETLVSAPCENSCPLHMHIPRYMQLMKENRMDEAFESIMRDNPLPASIGRICHFHCKLRCRREDIDAPVAQGEVHRYIADLMYEKKKSRELLKKLKKEKKPDTGKKIGIVGAGPAGLTAAYFLVRLGHKVTVFDQNSAPGGILRWGIPAYRLPRKVLEQETEFIKKLGVSFELNRTIKASEVKALSKKYDALILASGAYKGISPGIPGEKKQGVMSGTFFLEEIAKGKKPDIGKKVAVIGGGNVAIDAARTALRLGSEVTVVYRRERDDMPANEFEVEDAFAEKVVFKFLASPKAVTGKAKVKGLKIAKMKPGQYDRSGRRRPLDTGEEEEIYCDTVILAIGEKVDSAFLSRAGIRCGSRGALADPFTLAADRPGVFVCGDVSTGPGTAVQAMAQGKRAACSVDRYLTGQDRFPGLYRDFEFSREVPLKPMGGNKQEIKKTAVSGRVKNFQEVSCGLTRKQALAECERCLRCDVRE